MHPYLPKIPDARKREVSNTIRMGKPVRRIQKKPQQGHVYTKRIYSVCKTCNETWMGKIEEAAKPLLIPMLRGLPMVLQRTDRTTLSTWLALKIMIGESDDARDIVTLREERVFFMETRTIPPSMKIWIASHDAQDWYTGYWIQTLRANLTPDPPVAGNFKNIQATTFGFGHVLSFSLSITVPHLDLNPNTRLPLLPLRPLWPLTDSDIAWPLPNLSSSDAEDIANSLGVLMDSAMITWMPLG